mmetsp:Transcript_596/g.1393  ORF Transcript_596/g.1393 Transcript_596/m.1393 type:complete len:160 (+) Transcript_596:136-615(+)
MYQTDQLYPRRNLKSIYNLFRSLSLTWLAYWLHYCSCCYYCFGNDDTNDWRCVQSRSVSNSVVVLSGLLLLLLLCVVNCANDRMSARVPSGIDPSSPTTIAAKQQRCLLLLDKSSTKSLYLDCFLLRTLMGSDATATSTTTMHSSLLLLSVVASALLSV